jgi:hypothetical protein
MEKYVELLALILQPVILSHRGKRTTDLLAIELYHIR